MSNASKNESAERLQPCLETLTMQIKQIAASADVLGEVISRDDGHANAAYAISNALHRIADDLERMGEIAT